MRMFLGLLLLTSLGLAPLPGFTGEPVSIGQGTAEVEKALGAPLEKGPDRWRYGAREEFSEILLEWKGGRLVSATLHYQPARAPEKEIPAAAKLIGLEEGTFSDVNRGSRFLAEPSTGRVWELDASLKVVAFAIGKPWTVARSTRTLTRQQALGKAGEPSPLDSHLKLKKPQGRR
ncbi:MAG: hypothetical protein NDJ90_12140 [Oligoflexia bacterium]|nr:hypothetical protein [Oligoflexia bacterium]